MDSVYCKSLLRRSIATLLPKQPASAQAAAVFYQGWDEGARRVIFVSTIEQSSRIHTKDGHLACKYLRAVPALKEPAKQWSPSETGLLCPPIDMMAFVVRKLSILSFYSRMTRAPVILPMPNWPRQERNRDTLDLATKVHRLPTLPERIGRPLERGTPVGGFSCWT